MSESDLSNYKSVLAAKLPQMSPYITDTFISNGTIYAELKPGTSRSNIIATVPAPVTVEREGKQIAELGINQTHAQANHQHLTNAGP